MRTPTTLFLLSLALLAAAPARASTETAWAAFRKDVADRCVAAGKAQGLVAARVFVHPLGTESYGVAVLEAGADRRICIYDKRARRVELTPAS